MPSSPEARCDTPRETEAITQLPPSDVHPALKPRDADARIGEIDEAVRTHDYDRALLLAYSILKDRPADVVAIACINECGVALEELHEFSTASLQRVPSTAIGGTDLYSLKLDHRAGFILSLVDGVSTVALVLDMCPMPRPQALGVIFGLIKDGVLVFT